MNETATKDALNARFVERAKPGELRKIVKRLNLRTVIDGRRFEQRAFIEGQGGFSPEQILFAGRRQTHLRIRHLHDGARLRFLYFVLAQGALQVVRDAIFEKGLLGLTILAGHGRRFPKGSVYRSIDSLQVMTYNMRRDRPNDAGVLTDHFDVRLHVLELNRSDGTIHLGGSELINGQPYSRTVLSRDFSREPGRSHQAVSRARVDVIENALACHEALETASVSTEMGYQKVPVLPKLYLGFKDCEVPEFDTPSLRRAAMSHVIKWMRRGLAPESGSADMMAWQMSVIPKLMEIDSDSLEDWRSLSAILGSQDADAILTWVFHKGISEHEGLYLVPVSFFPKDYIGEVMPNVADVFVRLNDHLGRESFAFDGDTFVDRRYAKVQVLQLAKDQGTIGNLKFDLASTEVGREEEFS